jgi:hypothetical protein
LLARSFRRRNKKNATIAAITRPLMPMPMPTPIDTPVMEGELDVANEPDVDGIVEAAVDIGDDVYKMPVDEAAVDMDEKVDTGLAVCPPLVLTEFTVDAPIVAARTTRLLIPQHVSEVKSPPQHQLPSIAHCDIALSELAKPPSCPYQLLFLATCSNTYRRIRTSSL